MVPGLLRYLNCYFILKLVLSKKKCKGVNYFTQSLHIKEVYKHEQMYICITKSKIYNIIRIF